MYEEIFNQIRYAANKRNLKDSTIHAYCTSVAHFLNHTAKDIDALTNDDVDIFLTEKRTSKNFRKVSLFVIPKNNSFGKNQLSIKHEI